MRNWRNFICIFIIGVILGAVIWDIFLAGSLLISDPVPPWLISLIISAITGGTMGAIVNNILQKSHHKRVTNEKEAGIISALTAELRRSVRLCVYNASLKENVIGPFISFPTIAAVAATFEERNYVPKLSDMQNNLEAYTLGIIHVNQLIEVHQILLNAPEQLGARITGGTEHREKMRFMIADICSGHRKLEGVGLEDFIYLPTFIDAVLKRIEDLPQN